MKRLVCLCLVAFLPACSHWHVHEEHYFHDGANTEVTSTSRTSFPRYVTIRDAESQAVLWTGKVEANREFKFDSDKGGVFIDGQRTADVPRARGYDVRSD